MKYLNQRIARLQEMLSLEEKRATLQQELDSLQDRLNSLRENLFSENAEAESSSSSPRRGRPAKASAGAAAAPAPTRRRGKRMGRGELKEQILNALRAAGEAGVKVKDLAASLATKPVNIHSWFHSAQRRYPQIKKVVGGHYRLQGELPNGQASEGDKSPARQRGGRGRAKASPASSTTGRRKSSQGRAPRGELTSRIMTELGKAGKEGVTVKDLASSVGAPYKNIYIWFATTGKRSGKVKKVAPATYRLS